MNSYLEGAGFVLAILLGIAFFVFWLQMLVQAATSGTGADKVVWVLIILFTGIIGAALYAFAGPRTRASHRNQEDEDREMLRQMRIEFEGAAARRREPITLTAEEERLVQEMRRSYRGEQGT